MSAAMQCPMREIAAASALSAVTPEEQATLDRHLAEGCPVCADEIRLTREIAAGFVPASAQSPPASLRERLLGGLSNAAQAPGRLLEDQGLLIARSIELDWQPIGPGLATKTLHADPERHYNTLLVRFAPGAVYAAHRHTQVEHLFILTGDLHVAGVEMGPGDYCRAEPETVHGPTFSKSGCVALVMASPDDDLLT